MQSIIVLAICCGDRCWLSCVFESEFTLNSLSLDVVTYLETAITKFSMKFMQTFDILLFKKSISNVQFWYFLKIFLYQLSIAYAILHYYKSNQISILSA